MEVPGEESGEIARLVNEAFNGGGTRRVLVFPIPTTNWLFVKANPIDLLTIRKLLTRTDIVDAGE
jgi:hypothetical protein